MPDPKKSAKDENDVPPQYAVGETVDSEVVGKGRGVAPRNVGRYRVLRGGLTGAGGAVRVKDEIVSAADLGDQTRIQKLLDRGSIEAVDD